jgi:hypothetical protein
MNSGRRLLPIAEGCWIWVEPERQEKPSNLRCTPMWLALGTELCHTTNSYIDDLYPACQNVTLFGDRILTEISKLKCGH